MNTHKTASAEAKPDETPAQGDKPHRYAELRPHNPPARKSGTDAPYL